MVLPRLLLIFLSPSSPGSRLNRGQQRLRLDQDVAEEVVEAPNRFARQLQMRHLIVADRYESRVVNRHVRGLQQRVTEKPDRRQVLVLQVFLLFLVGRHALEPRHRDHHRQQQIQFRVFGHERLDEDRALLRVESRRNPVRRVLVGVRRQLRRVWRSRSSTRASRRRSSSSRTGPAAEPSCRVRRRDARDGVARWDACPKRRGPYQWTKEESYEPRENDARRGDDEVIEAAGEHQRVEQNEAVRPHEGVVADRQADAAKCRRARCRHRAAESAAC